MKIGAKAGQRFETSGWTLGFAFVRFHPGVYTRLLCAPFFGMMQAN
jgi:hypothetical protein